MKFALLDGKLKHISEVSKEDNCICPICHRQMIKYSDHFQHNGRTCGVTDNDIIANAIVQTVKEYRNELQIIKNDKTIESLSDYPIQEVLECKTNLGIVHPDLIAFNDKFRYFFYISRRGERKDKAELQLYKEETDYRIFVFKVRDFMVNRENIKEYVQKVLWGYNQTSGGLYASHENLTRPYGVCGNCNVGLELCINTYDDSSKPLQGTGISTIYARDDKNEDKDKQASYSLGSLLLRCPKCHRVMTVNCPACLKKGKLQDMKVMINNKKKHIFTCCTKYVSGRDELNTPEMIETKCNTSLILYSDIKGTVLAEEHKKVGGFFNWLTNYEN